MIQLTQTELLQEPGDLPKLRNEYTDTGCAALPGFLAPPILRSLMRWIDLAKFEERHEVSARVGVFGTTLFVPESDPALFLLKFILNRPELFKFSQQVSCCDRIGNFIGRLHRTTAGSNQQIDWHHDVVDGRILGICINLSSEPYTGGVFQIRDPEHRVKASMERTAPGDAFLFRIDKGWEHRLTAVESGHRTVGVGWFRTGPEWSAYAPSARRILAMTQPSTQSKTSNPTQFIRGY